MKIMNLEAKWILAVPKEVSFKLTIRVEKPLLQQCPLMTVVILMITFVTLTWAIEVSLKLAKKTTFMMINVRSSVDALS